MARSVAASGSKYLSRAAAVLTATPFTFAAWVRPTAVASYQAVLSISQNVGSANYHALYLNPSAGVSAYSLAGGGTTGEATSGGTMTANAWAHVAAVFSATTNRRAYLNGTGGTANTTTVNPGGLDITQIGTLWTGTNPATADVGEAVIYGAALTDADLASLAAGVSPLLVRPDALVAYYPLLGQFSPEIDLVGRNELTLNNAPAAAAHCRIIYPAGPLIWRLTAGAAAPSGAGGRMFQVF